MDAAEHRKQSVVKTLDSEAQAVNSRNLKTVQERLINGARVCFYGDLAAGTWDKDSQSVLQERNEILLAQHRGRATPYINAVYDTLPIPACFVCHGQDVTQKQILLPRVRNEIAVEALCLAEWHMKIKTKP